MDRENLVTFMTFYEEQAEDQAEEKVIAQNIQALNLGLCGKEMSYLRANLQNPFIKYNMQREGRGGEGKRKEANRGNSVSKKA